MKQFKRIISLVIAMTMLVSMFSVGMVSASAETQSYVLGDANSDTKVTILDATVIQRFVAGLPGYEFEEGTIEYAAADVNKDGKVSIFDATLIQQYVASYASAMVYGIGETFTFGEVEDPSEDESSEVESSETPSSSEDESSEVESSETPSSEDESSETPSSEEESSEDPSSEEPSSEEPSSEEESSETPSSEEPSSEEPSSEEPSEDVLTAGYYMVGIFNGEDCWDASKLTADRKLAENPDAAGEYILYWTFVGGDELKVAHFDGEKFDALYKVEAEPSYKIGATSDKTGYCSVKFNPAGRSDWSYTYLTVKRAEKPVDPTDKPTDAPSSEAPSSDAPSSETPEELVAGYYLVGMLNGVDCWSVDALTTDRLLKANPATAGEYMLDWTFVGGDEIKVAHFDGEKFDKWFNDGGDNYMIGATSNKVGPGTIYFRPEGNADWSYNFF
ncbi:MAG: dockerin type I repeat-containing protein, partial [Ruminococcus sp.]|nr:dockerin type I repeat-containing protein [Ruminococcus sp.]